MKKYLRKTKIVGTIGPASEVILSDLFDAGLNVCRIILMEVMMNKNGRQMKLLD